MPAVLILESSLKIINEAIQAELDAFYLYKHLQNQTQRLGLFGASKYFSGESEDELSHYQKHAEFLNERGTVAQLPTIEEFTDGVSGLMDALKTALQAELDLGDKYAKWYAETAIKDPITGQHLLQFLEFQRKSIGEYSDWIQRLTISGNAGASVILIDQEMGNK